MRSRSSIAVWRSPTRPSRNAVLALAFAALAFAGAAHAQDAASAPKRPVHTFSIVARDPATGELGVAVQSHWFSVGPIVPWVEAGVGAVATQSFVDPSYGKLGLDLMRAGKSAPEALKALIAGDAASDVRQVAMIDTQGRVAAHTGAKDIQAAGHKVGTNYSVQANLMLNDTVWPAMSRAFEAAKGDLADRMLAALDAAQAAGGDIRGRQSAALILVSGKPTGKPWIDRIFDLRVDDNPEPLKELRRLVVLQRAYNHMNAGDLAVERKDNQGALREYSAAAALAPGSTEMVYWHAVALVNMGRVDESLPLFRQVFKADKNWLTLTPRLVTAGQLPKDQKVIDRILKAAN
ncbi:MAG: Zn-dependent protease [Acidobacteria bacterium]|nr:MAG: Zn-dependent protease [Acidobacteriota bacterium]